MAKIELTGAVQYSVEMDDTEAKISARIAKEAEGLEYLEIVTTRETPGQMPVVNVRIEIPHRDIQGLWDTKGADKRFVGLWDRFEKTEATYSAPVVCLFASSGENRCTVACSDAIHMVSSRMAIREEDGCWQYDVRMNETFCSDRLTATVRFRIDTRSIRYEDALLETAAWWDAMPEFGHRDVPDFIRMPTYSTWYSYHQAPDAEAIEKEAALAKEMGFDSVILDDGWQMEDASRTYLWTGDWEVCDKIFPDMPAHVKKIHDAGMSYMVWFAVPFVGRECKAFKRFEKMFLPGTGDVRMLDPRYPEVRKYLIDVYMRAAQVWGIDGCKLDFVDCFRQPAAEDPDMLPGRDFDSVGEAVITLLDELMDRVKKVRPEFAIEFRQSYIGPRMRRCATMYRAADCPGDFRVNKLSTINLRLLSMSTAIHSDMLTWHKDEPKEAVAMQIQHVLFSVPQISVRIAELSADHRDALKYWMYFWREHRLTLLDGQLRAYHPELDYPLITAESDSEYIAVVYSEECVPLSGRNGKQVIVNSTHGDAVVCRVKEPAAVEAVLRDCLGNETGRVTKHVDGIFELAIPAAGIAELTVRYEA